EEPEYELIDSGIFAENRFFDVIVEYAKAAPEDIAIRISVTNHGPDPAPIHILPTLWCRNTWSWGYDDYQPTLRDETGPGAFTRLHIVDRRLGDYWLYGENTPRRLFTRNETNARRLWGIENRTPYVKDGINEAIVHGVEDAVHPSAGTKVA